MKSQALFIISLVIACALGLMAASIPNLPRLHPAVPLFWTALCVLSELFWVRTLAGDSVHSLGATVKLSTIFILGPALSLPVIFASTLTGNVLFRRPAWYKALYNASQLTVAGGAAALVYATLGGPVLFDDPFASPFGGLATVGSTLASRGFLLAFLLSGLAYIITNNTLMAWLMSAVTGRRLLTLWRENCLYPEEIQSSAALVLMSPLLILLYGMMGAAGLVVLFACLGLVRVANQRYVVLINMQDSLVRGERMAAMGDMAEEIGVTLGDYLKELKDRTGFLLQHSEQKQQPKLTKSVDIIHQNVDRMAALVEGLAAFSHQKIQRTATDLNDLIQRTVEFVQPQNRFDEVAFVFDPDPELPSVNIDGGQIQQVFINLMANAADAMNDHGSDPKRVRIESRFDSKTNRVRVTVVDTGPGIPAESLPRVFDPHFTTKPTGHGFGLSTAFRIVANHSGSIQAINLEDAGAEFSLELPAA